MGFLDRVGDLFKKGWHVADSFATAAIDVATAPFDQDELVQGYHAAREQGDAGYGALDAIGAGIAAPIFAIGQAAKNNDLQIHGPQAGEMVDTGPETDFSTGSEEMGNFSQRLNEVGRFFHNVVEYGVDRPLATAPNIVSMQLQRGQHGLDAWLPDTMNDLRDAYGQNKAAGAETSAGQAFAMLPYQGDTGRFAAVVMGTWMNPLGAVNLSEAGRKNEERGLTAEGRESIRITGGKMNTFDLASGSTDFSANLVLDPTNLVGGWVGKALKAKKGLVTARNLPRILREVESGTGRAGAVMDKQVQAMEAMREGALEAKSAELTKSHLEQVAGWEAATTKSGETRLASVQRQRTKAGTKTPRLTDDQILADVRAKRLARSKAKGFDPELSEIQATTSDLSLPDLKPWVIKQLQPDMTADMANLYASAMRISDDGARQTAYRHITRLGIGDITASRDLEQMRTALAHLGDEQGNIGLDELQHIIEKRPIEQGELNNLAQAGDNENALAALNKYNESWVAKLQPNGTLDDVVRFLDRALEQRHTYRSFAPGGAVRAARAVAGTEHNLPGTKAARQTRDNALEILSGKYALDQIHRGAENFVGGNPAMSSLRVLANPVDIANSVWRALRTHVPNRVIPVGDMDRGINGLVDYMDKGHVDPSTRNKILSEFASAPDDMARANVTLRAEKEAIASLSRRYGIDEDTADEIITRVGKAASRNGRSERFAVNEYIDAEGKTRFADTWADDGGTTIKPVLQTQQVEAVPLLDIQRFEKQVRRAAPRITAMSEWAKHPKWGGKMAQRLHDMDVAGIDVLDSSLTYVNNLWKFAAVFHGGYMFRNVLDGDLSVAAHLGGQVSATIIADRILKLGIKDLGARRAFERDMMKLHELEMIGSGADDAAEIARLTEKTANPNNYRNTRGLRSTVKFGKYEVERPFDGLEGSQFYNLSSGDIGAAFTTDQGRKGLEHMRSGSWVKMKPSDDGHIDNWAHVINRQFLQDPAAFQVIKNDLDADGLVRWLGTTEGRAYRRKLGKIGLDADDWAARAVGMVNHYIPPEVADELRRTGQEIHPDRLRRLAPEREMRPDIHGQEVNDQLGGRGFQKYIDATTNRAMRFIGELPDNHLTRHPTAAALYQLRAKELLAAHQGEHLTGDDLASIAHASRQFALREIKKVLYDIDHHSNAANKMRFLSPFFNAWQEGVKRYGLAVRDNPNVLYNAYRMWNMPNRNGFIIDEYGNPVTGPDSLNAEHRLAIPMLHAKAGENWKTGGPRSISKSALNIALQGDPFWSPGAGSLVTVPMGKLVAQVNDENLEKWWTKYIDPYGTSTTRGAKGTATAFLPAWMKRAKGLVEGPDNKEFHAALVQIYQDEMTKYETGQRRTKPTQDEIVQKAGHFQFYRLIFNMTLPFVPRNGGDFAFLRDKYRQLQDEGNANHPDEQGWAQDQFLQIYGDDFFYLTQSGSKGQAGMAPTVGAEDAFRQYRGTISHLSNPLVAGAIAAPESGGEFSRMVYNAQFGEKVNPTKDGPENMVRSPKDLPTLAHDAELSRSWSQYRAMLHDINATAMDRGGESYRDFDDLNDLRKQMIRKLSFDDEGHYTPWGQEFGGMRSPGAFDSYVDDFRKVVADPKLSGRQDVVVLKDYVHLRDLVREELLKRPSQNITNSDNQDLRYIFTGIVNKMVQSNTVFDDVWYVRFISNDPYYDEELETEAGP